MLRVSSFPRFLIVGWGWAIKHIIEINVPDKLEKLAVIPLLLYRRLRYGYAFRRIRLTQGKYTIVDSDDYMRLAKLKWHAIRGGNTFYAARGEWIKATKQSKQLLMQNFVIAVPKGYIADHINRNGLDNRKKNLRVATQSQNARNALYPKKNCSSKYRGVWYSKRNKKWCVKIVFEGKRKQFGCFQDEKEAAKAYDAAAKKYFGKFAILNLKSKIEKYMESRGN